MPVRSLWSNVAVAMQSALTPATPQDITTITKADPGLVTYSGATDPVVGDYVLLNDIQGMTQLNERVFRAATVTAASNTFELEGEDTTSYDTFVSSPESLSIITFGINFTIITGVTASGGEPEEVDATTIHDTVRQIIYGAFTPSQFSMDAIWDPADAGLAAIKAATVLKAKRAFRFTFANGYKHLFYGQVAALGDPTGTAQGLVTTPMRITRSGGSTFYEV